jgi:hypothetical protein
MNNISNWCSITLEKNRKCLKTSKKSYLKNTLNNDVSKTYEARIRHPGSVSSFGYVYDMDTARIHIGSRVRIS